MNKFLGMTQWTWVHVLAVPSILLATAFMPTQILVFGIILSFAVRPTWFRYLQSNARLLLVSPFYAVQRPLKYGSPFVISEMSDEYIKGYNKNWWGGNDPDDSDLKDPE